MHRDKRLLAGFGSIDLTPSGVVDLCGFASRQQPSTGVAAPVSGRVVALRSGRLRAALVVCDLLGFTIADSRRLASALESLGHLPAKSVDDADVIVLNTCVVRQSAEDKVYGRLGSLRPLKSRRPEVVIGLMGCLVGVRDPAPLHRRFPWVDVFMPPSSPAPLLSHLADRGMVDEGQAQEAAKQTPEQGPAFL